MDFNKMQEKFDVASGDFAQSVLHQCDSYKKVLDELLDDDSLPSNEPAARAVRKDLWAAYTFLEKVRAAADSLTLFIELEIHSC